MPYRNKEWYIPIIKTMSMERAYEYISENLKAPSFVYEHDNASAAYKEVFGIEFASPQERAMKTAADKIRELEAENERLKLLAKQSGGEDSSDEKSANGKMTQDEFAATHPEIPAGLKMYHAYQKYLKE
jgi:hypothetical protein